MRYSRFFYRITLDPAAPNVATVVIVVDRRLNDLFVTSSTAEMIARSLAIRVWITSSERIR